MLKKPDNWLRLGFTLAVFLSVLCIMDLFLTDVADFNLALNSTVVRQGYITAMRAMFLLISVVGVGSMTALLRRGFIVAPAVWAAQLVRLVLSGPGLNMVKNLIFVSEWLNLVAFILLPILFSLLLWQCLEHIDEELSLGKFAVPFHWILLAGLISAASLFSWHWSLQFGLAMPGTGYGLILSLVGMIILVSGAARQPVNNLFMFYSGILVPGAVCMTVWGWYEGLTLALMSILPFSSGEFALVWAELAALIVLPILIVLGLNQLSAWRRGEKLIELI